MIPCRPVHISSSELPTTQHLVSEIAARPPADGVFRGLGAAAFPFRVAIVLARLMAAVIAGHLMIVGVTFFDEDGRCLLYFFPFIVVFAACGAASVLERRRRGR